MQTDARLCVESGREHSPIPRVHQAAIHHFELALPGYSPGLW